MKATRPLTIIGLLAIGSGAFAEQNLDELKQRVLAQAQTASADDYAFTRTIRNDGTMAGKSQQTTMVERYDPSRAADARWSLVSVNGAPPPADALQKFRKETPKRRVPGYHRLANYIAAAASIAQDSQRRTVLRFASLPKESAIVMDSDVSENTSAEVALNTASETPFAEQVRLTVKPMRLKLVMKLNSYESTSRYRMGPDGKPLLVEQVADMSGSGMGQEGRMHTVITYSDYRLVRGQH
jgi:hypothetical protein